jgi:hypothetical protein
MTPRRSERLAVHQVHQTPDFRNSLTRARIGKSPENRLLAALRALLLVTVRRRSPLPFWGRPAHVPGQPWRSRMCPPGHSVGGRACHPGAVGTKAGTAGLQVVVALARRAACRAGALR